MTKDKRPRLRLRKSVLRVIDAGQLAEVAGGVHQQALPRHPYGRGLSRYCID